MSLSIAQIEKHQIALSKLIDAWLEENPNNPSVDLASDIELSTPERGDPVSPKQIVTVALRTRPFLENETSDGKQPLSGIHARGTKMIVHVPASKWSGPTIQHKSFEGDFSFGPESTSDHVYQSLVVKPETYTISSLEEIISRDIFPAAKAYAESHFPNSSEPAEEVYAFGVSLYELLGNKVSDLLDRDAAGNGANVEVAEDKFGGIRVSAKVVPVTNSQELASMIASAAGHRRTSATLKNETSSRSHCVLTITITNTLVPSAEPGRLVLVDLAGSERAADRSAHTKDRMDENTLTYVSPFRVTTTPQTNGSVPSPSAWTNDEFRAWVGKTSTKIDPAKLAPFESGKQMCELEEAVFIQRCLGSQKDGLVGTNDALTEKGAKAFYDKLWGLIFAAKESIRRKTKLKHNPPSVWSNFQVRDFVEKELWSIDIEKFCPSLGANPRRGRDFVQDMGEAEFILLATSAAKEGQTVTVEDAKDLHTKMWKLENDTRNAERNATLAQRQDENAGMVIDDELLGTLLDHPAVYGTGPEAVARKKEAIRVIRSAREAKLQREKKRLEQQNREQAESDN
ncbi:hypothetical protein FRC10_000728 [Ceratobasidium sp. 414]|nr:hypothetical protein FRC10_000728 [Ceratobasidium sp. 414]